MSGNWIRNDGRTEWRKGVTLYAPAILWRGHKNWRCVGYQRSGLPFLLTYRSEKHKLCRRRGVFASCQVLMKAMQWLQKKRSNNQKPRWPSLLMYQSKTQICLRNYDDLLNQQAFSTIALKIHENCMKMCQNDKFQKNCKQCDFWMKWNLSLKGRIPPSDNKFNLSKFDLDPKTNRVAPRIKGNTCFKCHHCMSKGNNYSAENLKRSKSVFDLDLWPNDPKINGGPPWVMMNSCVKYHYCM